MKTKLILEDLLDIYEIADLFKLSVSSLRKMCMRKQIPHHKIGRKVFFYRPEIAKWVESNRAA